MKKYHIPTHIGVVTVRAKNFRAAIAKAVYIVTKGVD